MKHQDYARYYVRHRPENVRPYHVIDRVTKIVVDEHKTRTSATGHAHQLNVRYRRYLADAWKKWKKSS